MEEITPTYWDREPKSVDDSMAYLAKIPSNMILNEKNLLSEEKNFGLPEWFKETAGFWGQDMITDKEFVKNIEYLVQEGIIESHTSSVFQELVIESESSTASTSVQSPVNEQNSNESLSQELVVESESLSASSSIPTTSNEQNSDESLSQDPVSEEPPDISIESVTENEKNIPVEIEDISKLFESVSSIPGIDSVTMSTLEPATCDNLENFFMLFEYLIDTNKIDQSLGQSLIAQGELVKLDLCN